jgi:hypothetical protein
MKQLRELCSRLSKEGAVAALLAAMQSDSAISSFEFLNSGTVHQLKDYLLGALAFVWPVCASCLGTVVSGWL